MSRRLTSADTLSPSRRESAAGSEYVAPAESCAATPAPAIARSRALMLGTTYPPAKAAAGSMQRIATVRLRMVVSLFLRPHRRRHRVRGEEGRHVTLRGSGERFQAGADRAGRGPRRADAAPIDDDAVRHRSSAGDRFGHSDVAVRAGHLAAGLADRSIAATAGEDLHGG